MIQILKVLEQEFLRRSETFIFQTSSKILRIPISEILNDCPSKENLIKIGHSLILLKYFCSTDNQLKKECGKLNEDLIDSFNSIIQTHLLIKENNNSISEIYENSSEDEVEEYSHSNKKLLLPSQCTNSINFTIQNSKRIVLNNPSEKNLFFNRSSMKINSGKQYKSLDITKSINEKIEKRLSFATTKVCNLLSTYNINVSSKASKHIFNTVEDSCKNFF